MCINLFSFFIASAVSITPILAEIPPRPVSKVSLTADSAITSGILINEILFNPKSGGAEFIEIYNHSDKTIDLQNLKIARIIGNDSLVNIRQISAGHSLFLPGEYKVLTKDPAIVQLHYYTENPEAFISVPNMPQLPNQSGSIALLEKNMVIDRLDYHAGMHDPLVKDPKGVSLERKKFDEPTNSPTNFTSAAAVVGYATPGYKNSQHLSPDEEREVFWLTSKTFSPDQDGFEDELQINYHFNESGNVANIYVYNDRGTMVRQLYKNHSLAVDGLLSWDGLSDMQQRLPLGIYVIYIETYNATDGVKKYRKSCVLAAKF